MASSRNLLPIVTLVFYHVAAMSDQPPHSGTPDAATPATPPPALTPPPTDPGSLLLLHGELRSDWRLLFYILLLLPTTWLLNVGGHAVLHPPKIWGELIGRIVFFLVALLPALLMNLFERRPFASYGLPLRSAFGRNFWVGALWGLASLSLLLGVMAAAGAFHVSALALQGAHIWKWAAFWGVVFLFVGFSEEFLFRGYSLYTLTQGIGFWPSAGIFSLLFGAVHIRNGGESWMGAAAAGLIGFFFCLTLRRTGNLWWAVGFHAAWDWAESFLFSVPDSGTMVQGHLVNSTFQGPAWLTGGSVGPEGSLLVFALIAAVMWLFARMYPAIKYGEAEALAPTASLVPAARPEFTATEGIAAPAAPVPVSPDNQL